MKVLVVEDDQDMVQLLKRGLEAEGDFDVAIVDRDFARLLHDEFWKTIDIEAAVVDYMLPLVRGDEILKTMERACPKVRRILFTAAGYVAAEVAVHAHMVLLKPASPSMLAQALRSRND